MQIKLKLKLTLKFSFLSKFKKKNFGAQLNIR